MGNSAESQLPDWLDSTLAEAQKRADESPALAPPPIMAEDGALGFSRVHRRIVSLVGSIFH